MLNACSAEQMPSVGALTLLLPYTEHKNPKVRGVAGACCAQVCFSQPPYPVPCWPLTALTAEFALSGRQGASCCTGNSIAEGSMHHLC